MLERPEFAGLVAHTYNPKGGRVGGSRIQGHPSPHRKLETQFRKVGGGAREMARRIKF